MTQTIKQSLPNILTIIRLLMVPLLAASFYALEQNSNFKPVILSLFIAASITDFLDGYLARQWSVQTKFGALLDPIADKVIVVTSVFMLVYIEVINHHNIFPALIIICRESLMSDWREYTRLNNEKHIEVSNIAKIKTTLQMCSIALLVASINGNHPNIEVAGIISLWIAAATSVISIIMYIRDSLSASK